MPLGAPHRSPPLGRLVRPSPVSDRRSCASRLGPRHYPAAGPSAAPPLRFRPGLQPPLDHAPLFLATGSPAALSAKTRMSRLPLGSAWRCAVTAERCQAIAAEAIIYRWRRTPACAWESISRGSRSPAGRASHTSDHRRATSAPYSRRAMPAFRTRAKEPPLVHRVPRRARRSRVLAQPRRRRQQQEAGAGRPRCDQRLLRRYHGV